MSTSMDSATALQQLSQIMLLQSLMSASASSSGKFSPSMGMNSPQFRQMPSLAQMLSSPKMPQLPSIPPAMSPLTTISPTDQSNLDALTTVSKLLSAHQNLKSQISPLSSPSTSATGFPLLQIQSLNQNFRSSPYSQHHSQQSQQYQHRPQPEYRLAVTRESAKPLQDWMNVNIHHPYPSTEDIQDLSKQTGFSHKQIRNWFTNNRRRYEQQFLDQPLPWTKKLSSNRKSSTPELSPSPPSTDTSNSQTAEENLEVNL